MFLPLNSSKEFHRNFSISGKTRRAKRRLGGDDQRSPQEVVQGILQRLFERVKSIRTTSRVLLGSSEQFLTDKNVVPTANSRPEWGDIEFREEENYYFSLASTRIGCFGTSKIARIAVIPVFGRPNYAMQSRQISGDLCISRPNRGSIGESSFRSTRFRSLMSGSTP